MAEGRRERRYKIFHVLPRDLLGWLEGLSEGYRAEGVRYDRAYRRFQFLVYHLSFDVVPDGEIIPTSAAHPLPLNQE
jgi:hypothetical protein